MDVFLTKNEQKILSLLSETPYTQSELREKLSFKEPWRIPYYLEHLEDEYDLIEELTASELDALLQGRNYLDEEIAASPMSGKYTITRNGILVLEQIKENTAAEIKEFAIPIISALLGALAGGITSYIVSLLT